MTQRLATFPVGMNYERGSDPRGKTGHCRAKTLLAASARFQQETVAAVALDTHTERTP